MPLLRRFDSVGDLNRRGPLPIDLPREPDADIGVLLIRPAKPGGDKAVLRLDDCRGVARCRRSGLVNELGLENGLLRRVGTAHHKVFRLAVGLRDNNVSARRRLPNRLLVSSAHPTVLQVVESAIFGSNE